MQIDIALLADYAAVTNDRKLVAAGIFRMISATRLPVEHSRMYLALQVRVLGGEEEKHHLAVRLVDPDGQMVSEIAGPLEVQRKDMAKDFTMSLVIDMAGMKFQKWGPHSFDVFADERFVDRVELEIVRSLDRNNDDRPDM